LSHARTVTTSEPARTEVARRVVQEGDFAEDVAGADGGDEGEGRSHDIEVALFDREERRIGVAGADEVIVRGDLAQLADALDARSLRVGEIAEERVVGLDREQFVHA
jgi:hypothetical protein